ncbi:nuclear transport factor 2 family protein [Luteipulveratus halotolerans]|uniref:SnoaL-like domain-containing protein n=1 Tax=Luteipulveratus halotolerans TaxID=1631356 RepID=A0A0L6CLD3_9MICO|nr:nuclear transport factor 2 family protein [Luteipulveratus halotolerans]KNX38611.1 hypothetical protein VV01_18040 [Luteipulveratus halotolerans]
MSRPNVLQARQALELWGGWLDMWNKDPAVALDIIDDDYALHIPDMTSTIDPGTVRRPADMKNWVTGFTDKFEGLTYSTLMGPIMEPEQALFGFRWEGRGTWTGATGWPLDRPGEPVLFVGVDIFRVRGDRIAEAWSQGAVTRTL